MSGESKWPDGKTSSDWYSLAGLIREMETELGTPLILCLTSAGNDERPDLRMTLVKGTMEGVLVERAYWGSVSYQCSEQRFRTLVGGLFFLLYQGDFFASVDALGEPL